MQNVEGKEVAGGASWKLLKIKVQICSGCCKGAVLAGRTNRFEIEEGEHGNGQVSLVKQEYATLPIRSPTGAGAGGINSGGATYLLEDKYVAPGCLERGT